MCTEYTIPTSDAFEKHFRVQLPLVYFAEQVFKRYAAPMLRLSDDPPSNVLAESAEFGLLPFFCKMRAYPFETMSARSETVAVTAAYRTPWHRRQLCLVPMQTFIESNYECGEPQAWHIWRRDGQPFAAAGIFDRWTSPQGGYVTSFSLLTREAQRHRLMQRFLPLGKSKRSIVVVPPARYLDWLNASDESEVRGFITLFEADEFDAGPARPQLTSVQKFALGTS